MTRWQTDEPEFRRTGTDDLPLFAPPEVRKLARRTDGQTSKAAAVSIVDQLPHLQFRVYVAFVEHGPMTSKTLEALPELADLGFSTARKRLSELSARGVLVPTGRIVEGCKEFRAAQ